MFLYTYHRLWQRNADDQNNFEIYYTECLQNVTFLNVLNTFLNVMEYNHNLTK